MNITKVYLLDVPLEKDYRNTLYFTNAESQYNYFYGQRVKSYTDFSYQRKDKFIRVPDDYDTIKNCNYVMYQNTAQANKWYYAFIDKMEYVSDGRTDVFIKTDVIQTYLFDYTVNPSFIEREHVDNDTIGLHTIPENLETGDFVVNTHLSDSFNNSLTIVLSATLTPGELTEQYGGNYNGIPSGIAYYAVPDIPTLKNILNAYASAGKSDAITGLFIAPTYLTTNQGGVITNSNEPATNDLGISRMSSLDGYIPRNKKLLTHPFCYILITNGQGGSAVFKQERWNLNNNNEMVLKIVGVLTPGCSIKAVPVNYNGDGVGIDQSLNLGKFPALNWTTDQFTNWLTQSGVNYGIAGDVLTIGAGIALTATGVGGISGGGLITTGVMGVLNSMNQIREHSFVPPQAEGNLNSGDVTTAMGANRFHCYKMSIKNEYAKICDSYFDVYGYKVNTVKVPNVNHRANWWYTKTIDANITGAIPNEDLDLIRTCYNNGITFWKNPATIYDYTQNNAIIS